MLEEAGTFPEGCQVRIGDYFCSHCFTFSSYLQHRIVAETHYQLGVAQGFNAQYDEAVESLGNSITLIKARIGNLQKAEGEKAKKEVVDLEALIPEIEEKIKDTKASVWFRFLQYILFIFSLSSGPQERIREEGREK